MTLALGVPSATADVVELADFVELMTLRANDGSTSVADLISELNVGATAEVLDADPHAEDGLTDPNDDVTLVNPGGDVLEALGEGALAEIEQREVACGGSYPFRVNAHGVVSRKAGALTTPYVFMLLLTRFGGKPKVGASLVSKVKATEVFEQLAVVAACEYFGWHDDHTLVYPFGFPRRHSKSGFKDAVNDLCSQINEGKGCKPSPNLADQNDGGLDLVVVRRFPDRRPGQMLGFGQCATGANWREKLAELQPDAFCKLWMIDQPAVTPLRMYFVPHVIEEHLWLHSVVYGGVLFDRCRMAYYSTPPYDAALRNQMATWSEEVMTKKVLP